MPARADFPTVVPVSVAGRIVQVALVPPQGRLDALDYVLPEDLAERTTIGSRVVVPLGKRFALGIVVGFAEHSDVPGLRPVAAVVDVAGPVLDRTLVELGRWIAQYYLGSLSEAITTMLPGGLQVRVDRLFHSDPASLEQAVDPHDRAILECMVAHGPISLADLRRRLKHLSVARLRRLCREGNVLVTYQVRTSAPTRLQGASFVRVIEPLPEPEAERWRCRRPALWRLYAYLHDHPLGAATLAELRANFPGAAAKVRALEAAGVVQRVPANPEPAPAPVTDVPAPEEVQLTEPQARAVARMTDALAEGFRVFLLHGVTGSGKTEVYLRVAQACVQAGRTALFLVPEISLTHQLAVLLRARFGNQVALLHSGLSPKERWQHWEKIAAGDVSVVAGARSAVFAPLRNMGLVIVDEEHDTAYKQDEGLRYHARDVAVVRARMANCPVVLGSATPSLESYFNAQRGRYELLELPERIDTRPLPAIEFVDLRGKAAARHALPFSRTLRTALAANLAARQQTLLFLNRRGYARFLQCVECGDVIMCPNCSVSLTYHRRKAALQCHHCGRTVPAPDRCLRCGSTAVAAWAAGTEQVEQLLQQLFPSAKVGRLDRDVVGRRGALQEVLHHWEQGRYDVLVGTQMVAKGHHVPGVTLVGVLLADLTRNFPDFRSGERAFQLLVQVAGRAGRGDKPGRVIVQTYCPDDPVWRWAAKHDYASFARCELAQREELGYPPFSRLVLARVEARSEVEAERTARLYAEAARALAGNGVAVLGPAPAPLLRLRGWYRYQVLLRAKESAKARSCAAKARERVRAAAASASRVRVVLDVDPQSLL